jgi:hypothetical protein
MKKSKDASREHKQWISSLPDPTIVVYTDESKLDNGKLGGRWSIYCVGGGGG